MRRTPRPRTRLRRSVVALVAVLALSAVLVRAVDVQERAAAAAAARAGQRSRVAVAAAALRRRRRDSEEPALPPPPPQDDIVRSRPREVGTRTSVSRAAFEHAVTGRRPSIRDSVMMKKEAEKVRFFDPLNDVLLNSPSANKQNPFLETLRKDVADAQRNAVEWLDSSNTDDRELLGRIFEYCGNLFAARGTDRNCIVQCHPTVDCGTQAARECLDLKNKSYKEYVTCIDRENQFCEKYGEFNGEKYPNYRPAANVKADKRPEEVLNYCGSVLQMRGVKLTCLRECTLYELKAQDPDKYYRWKAKHRVSDLKDPTLHTTGDGQHQMTECEKQGMQMCQFLPQFAWRECYERLKFSCLKNTGQLNPVLSANYM